MQIKEQKLLTWPEPARNTERQKNSKRYCQFHQSKGHDTEKCTHLMNAIEDVVRRGQLEQYINLEIQEEPEASQPEEEKGEMVGFISGGPGCGGESSASRKSYARMVGTTQETETPRRRSRPAAPIIFYDNDVSKVRHPHDDALVIAIKVSSFQMKRVLIDSGSSVDILFWSAFERMRYDADDLLPVKSSLVGFSGGVIQPEGMISLPVTVGNSPRSSTVTTKFLVVRCASSCNVILGRPTLNSMKAIISTYHLLLKFPTESGSAEVRGDQPLARQCYFSTLKGKVLNKRKTRVSEAMLVSRIAEREDEGLRPTPVEELLTVPLDATRADRTARRPHESIKGKF
ncbi:hypothetical protein J5N97_024835 [Dioscorea zingiberensis]|uniref:Uncharacterized protein n=1 Tax=Dioscorea zingiberensis TaxID=325984 RepID=A0A9D5C802_9LILI|nr:hypothetical protein J5N97_024835 [Dioscorea zingiberensis]